MSSLSLALTASAGALALLALGGGLYEFVVIDPVWPKRPELVQPAQGGISRKRFWIAIHVAFELALLAAVVVSWRDPGTRTWLLAAVTSHGAMRLWSAFDFIPKALAFERAPPGTISEQAAVAWTRRSRLRMPLDLFTCAFLWVAVATAAGLA